MPKIINPMLLSPEDAQQLFGFFEAQSKLGIHVWQAGRDYPFSDDALFQFTHLVVQRKRKESKPGVRYEFVSDTVLGQGRFGRVCEVAGTLALEPDFTRYKQAGYNSKTRVVKIQNHDFIKNSLRNLVTEYELSQLATHLAVKAPTLQELVSYSVMRKIEGQELFGILDVDRDGTRRLTLLQRIALSKALLSALKHQVTDKGIIHRDLKPENILVDLTAIAAYIIDFGLSVRVGINDGRRPGTPAYAAPELFDKLEQTVKIDVFSMARILAILWGASLSSYSLRTMSGFVKNARNVDLSSLFRGLTAEVSLENQTIIRDTLAGMMRRDAVARFSIDEAIAGFDQLVVAKPIFTPSFFSQASTPSGVEEVVGDAVEDVRLKLQG